MNDRVKLLKVISLITTSLLLLSFIFLLIISNLYGFAIYPYICLLISVIPSISLWKMYIDEKKHNNTK